MDNVGVRRGDIGACAIDGLALNVRCDPSRCILIGSRRFAGASDGHVNFWLDLRIAVWRLDFCGGTDRARRASQGVPGCLKSSHSMHCSSLESFPL
jgi:hypothetical protein